MHIKVGAFVFSFLLAVPFCKGDVLYVDNSATGKNDGTSWCDAYVNLQDALAAPLNKGKSAREIRVAGGTYKPDQGGGSVPGDQSATFHLFDGLTLLGGFAGCGALKPNERDHAKFITVLTGDLSSNDHGLFENYDNNSFNVVRADGVQAAIDGFVIEHGNGNGGGVNATQAVLTVAHCTFRQNAGTYGGGFFADGDILISDSKFIGNRGINGGAIFVLGNVVAERTDFVSNFGERGGAISMLEGRFTATDSIFANNRAVHRGGAIDAGRKAPRVYLERCFVVGNQSDFGGGFHHFEAELKLFNSVVAMNTASLGGGMLLDENTGDNQIVHSTIANNVAEAGGGLYGAACNYPDRYAVTNSVIWENRANDGAQIYLDGCDHEGPMDIFRVSYSDIEGGQGGVPVDLPWSLDWEITNQEANPLFLAAPIGSWSDEPIYEASSGETVLRNAAARWVPGSLAGKLINPDVGQSVGFLIAGNDSTRITVLGDASLLGLPEANYSIMNYRLGNLSPCINVGTALVSLGESDLDGRNRTLGDLTDIGAYESGDCDINGVFDGDDLANGAVEDCDDNAIPDACDLMGGLVEDCALNGIPDHCEGDSACDDDGDGVANEDDGCANSDMSAEIVFGDCQTGIENQMAHKGCMMADQLVECEGEGPPRRKFVRCVLRLTGDWRSDGLITRQERAKLIACAVRE